MLKEKIASIGSPLYLPAKYALRRIRNGHPLLISGETGTGKTHMAKWIAKYLSHDKETLFLNHSCAGLTYELFRSEMFGYSLNHSHL